MNSEVSFLSVFLFSWLKKYSVFERKEKKKRCSLVLFVGSRHTCSSVGHEAVKFCFYLEKVFCLLSFVVYSLFFPS